MYTNVDRQIYIKNIHTVFLKNIYGSLAHFYWTSDLRQIVLRSTVPVRVRSLYHVERCVLIRQADNSKFFKSYEYTHKVGKRKDSTG